MTTKNDIQKINGMPIGYLGIGLIKDIKRITKKTPRIHRKFTKSIKIEIK
jgi:hypothetical protein